MRFKHIIYTLAIAYWTALFCSGCAQIGAPTGGPRDTIPPHLLNAIPKLSSTNFSGNKVVLNFDEYVDVQDVNNNVLVSPYPKSNPAVTFKFKTVTIKLKDTLLPNTTYSINFGNAIRDLNEGNPLKNFTYVFSTGNMIDTLSFSGKIILAESGKTDSTIIAVLYHNLADSAVQKLKPNYISKTDGKGNFTFNNLPAGKFKVYALRDGDGSKTYNSSIEGFAFLDSAIDLTPSTSKVALYAYEEEKNKKTPAKPSLPNKEKKLKYSHSITAGTQDILKDIEITFNKPLKKFDSSKIILTDTLNKKIPDAVLTIDSTRQKIALHTKWTEDNIYKLIVLKDAVADSADNSLTKNDTLKFRTLKESDYGSLLIRFKNLVVEQHPVLQFIQNEEIVRSIRITTTEWSEKLFPPGEYELRILYDDNNNGKWDPGNYSKKIQPEKAITLDKNLLIKANWDNEREIQL